MKPGYCFVTNDWQIIILCISSSLFSCKESEEHPASSLSFWLPSICPFLSPGQTDSQVNASLQYQNLLCTDLRRVGKQIRKSARKSTQLAKGRRFIHYRWLAIALCGQKVEVDLRTNFRPIKVNAKTMQVGGQAKRSWKLALTCESVSSDL